VKPSGRFAEPDKFGRVTRFGANPRMGKTIPRTWIVDVDSPGRAYAIAARASPAPGLGGAPINMAIEVRQAMSGPPEEFQ